MKIVFLVSGGGGNLKFINEAIKDGVVKNLELAVVADRSCRAVQYADKNNLEFCRVSYEKECGSNLQEVLMNISPDLIVTNWWNVLDDETVGMFNGKLVNLHYSLLPAFSGLLGVEPVRRALVNNCRFAGPTCHFVDNNVDSGLIIGQSVFRLENLSLDEAVKIMFFQGCLVLLNSIQVVSGERLVEEFHDDDLLFSPSLEFDRDVFSYRFWERVRLL